jgi:hypothetical protein
MNEDEEEDCAVGSVHHGCNVVLFGAFWLMDNLCLFDSALFVTFVICNDTKSVVTFDYRVVLRKLLVSYVALRHRTDS